MKWFSNALYKFHYVCARQSRDGTAINFVSVFAFQACVNVVVLMYLFYFALIFWSVSKNKVFDKMKRSVYSLCNTNLIQFRLKMSETFSTVSMVLWTQHNQFINVA